MKRNNKSGFTLIELMVVAIIVAILAAVAIPLMSGNKDRAIATEAQAGIGTVVTAIKVYVAENNSTPTAMGDLKTIKSAELNGKYFTQSDYGFTGVTYDSGTGELEYTVNAGTEVVLTVQGGTNEWSGTLMD